MEKTTIYLDGPTARALRRLARATGSPQAAIIRRALGEYLRRPRRVSLGTFIGCVDSGDSGLAAGSSAELRAMAERGELDDR